MTASRGGEWRRTRRPRRAAGRPQRVNLPLAIGVAMLAFIVLSAVLASVLRPAGPTSMDLAVRAAASVAAALVRNGRDRPGRAGAHAVRRQGFAARRRRGHDGLAASRLDHGHAGRLWRPVYTARRRSRHRHPARLSLRAAGDRHHQRDTAERPGADPADGAGGLGRRGARRALDRLAGARQGLREGRRGDRRVARCASRSFMSFHRSCRASRFWRRCRWRR